MIVTELLLLLVVAVLAYLLGSIPFGFLLTRYSGLGDIRQIGSGNIGATNVLRTGRKGLAAATLVLDGGKGAVAVALAALLGFHAAEIAAIAAVLGHLFPIWLGFKGGKGVATTIGVLLALSPPVGIMVCLVWLATAVVFRYSSLAAIVAVASSPILAMILADPPHAAVALVLAVLVIYRHKENIERLRDGTENRIGSHR